MLIAVLVTNGTAQRYFSHVFETVLVERNIPYGMAPDYLGVHTTLLLDVYQPEGDTESRRPLVILVHGGGFTGGGKAGENFQTWGNDLARRGFIVASIDYRLGTTSKTEAKPMWEASLRAGQDVRAAVRYLRSMQQHFRIDTSHIFLVGTSAGGLAIVQASHLDDDEVPDFVDASLGTVEGNSGTPGESSRVHALVVCWGATTDTLFMEPGDPPIIAIHGTTDKTVPYQCGASRFGFDLCGAEPLTERAATLGIRNSRLLFNGVGHTLDGNPILLDSCYRFLANELAELVENDVVASTPELDMLRSCTVFPNPARAGHVVYLSSEVRPSNVTVADVTGQVIECMWHIEGTHRVRIHVPNDLVPGLVLVIIQTPLTTKRMSLIVVPH